MRNNEINNTVFIKRVGFITGGLWIESCKFLNNTINKNIENINMRINIRFL
jgi:hypothetical protein